MRMNAIMRVINIFLILSVIPFVGICGPAEADDQDNMLLLQVLSQHYKNGGFTVVAPETYIFGRGRNESALVEMKRRVVDKLRIEGYDIGPLFDKLMEKNSISYPLSLKSSPENGYLIDYDGKFAKYFVDKGDGWEKWYSENPTAYGWTRVSLPVCDAEAGIVLVYKDTQSHWLGGAGSIIAYRMVGGVITELSRVRLWVS